MAKAREERKIDLLEYIERIRNAEVAEMKEKRLHRMVCKVFSDRKCG